MSEAFMPESLSKTSRKKIVWTNKNKERTPDQWKPELCSDGSRIESFVPPSRFLVRPGKGEQMFSTCVVPTVKDGGGGVACLGAPNTPPGYGRAI